MRITLIILCCLNFTSFSQSIIDAWKPILSQKEVAVYFQGMWQTLGINVEETNEKVTVYHLGDHFEMKEGIDSSAVDYNVFLKAQNVLNMSDHGADGKIDEYESYKIMSVLFTPFVRASLTHPMMNKAWQMKIAHIENHVHVYLNSPANDEYVAHTLIFLNKRWMVIPGIYGEAERVFRLTPTQAVAYQKEAFAAQKVNTRKSWKQFKKFYLQWRESVSEELK